jgi:hypothetical protein
MWRKMNDGQQPAANKSWLEFPTHGQFAVVPEVELEYHLFELFLQPMVLLGKFSNVLLQLSGLVLPPQP